MKRNELPIIDWLLSCDEPWTRYRTFVDLLGQPEDAPEVQRERGNMLLHPMVKELISGAAEFPNAVLRRHNDAAHPIYKLSTLADFGLRADDPGMRPLADGILGHQSEQGAFQTKVLIPAAFGGSNEENWSWMACDAPTLVYILSNMGLQDDECVQKAAQHIAGLVSENGWRCVVAPELGRFRGPGRKDDPCPIANLLALKALSLFPGMADGPSVHLGIEALLSLWENHTTKKQYLFGMGTDFQKPKYPFIWFDILHVADVLSRFDFVCKDQRFMEMIKVLTAQLDQQGRATSGSMYQVWKGWSFADKKNPSPWLTFLVWRVKKRIGE